VTQCSLVEIYKCFGEYSAEMFADLYCIMILVRDSCVEDAVQYIVSGCVCVYPSKHAHRITQTSEKLPQAAGVQKLKFESTGFHIQKWISFVCWQLYRKWTMLCHRYVHVAERCSNCASYRPAYCTDKLILPWFIIEPVYYKQLCDKMRTALFWNITQRVVVISHRLFGTTYRSHLQG
jgi:hypothetical protein